MTNLAVSRDYSCPCTLVTPCHLQCTCANPLSSFGCRRCCAYGSMEQRVAMAEALVQQEEARNMLAYAFVILSGIADMAHNAKEAKETVSKFLCREARARA